jgi:hypothetical protein
MGNFNENLSSSVLFTFTSELDYLTDMLINGIRARYSFESLPYSKKHFMIPMKCFCDIPLSKTKVHLNWYGDYGLGIRKACLTSQGVTPVFYVHDVTIKEVIKPLLKNSDSDRLAALTKRYMGTTYKLDADNNAKRSTKTFYDEREWRYIPQDAKLEWFPRTTSMKNGLVMAKEKNQNEYFSGSAIQLDFQDIAFIIIKNEKDIAKLRKALRKKFPENLDFELTLTKVITAKQIKKDF